MGKKIGIDLGTTYCCVAVVDDMGVVHIIPPSESDSNTTPSVVLIDPNGEVIVGATARSEGGMYPECVVERVKNYMGEPDYLLNINGKDYSPAAISSLILKKLIEKDAEPWLGDEEIEGVVITCPAYFGDAARSATIAAAENVTLKNGQKLKVLKILDEPTAAALAYGHSRNEDMNKVVMVYDLGGGTFDCTVMKMEFQGDSKKMEVITTGGNHQLGGKDWDARLTDYVIDQFCSMTGENPDDMKNDAEMMMWFSEYIEKAKKALTNKSATSLTVSFGSSKEKIEITRETFESLTESLLNETIQLVDDMLAKKGMSMDDIDEIILVGSSTKMPQVSARLQSEYGKPINSYEPDKAVAMGAALVACGMEVGDISESDTDGVIIVDDVYIAERCTKSYGLKAKKGDTHIVGNIIYKDMEKPTVETRTFVTEVANQTSLNLEVFENDSFEQDVSMEESIQIYESCSVPLTPGLRANAPIEITFNLDKNGVLKIIAYDPTNGVTQEAEPVRIGSKTDSVGMDEVKCLKLSD